MFFYFQKHNLTVAYFTAGFIVNQCKITVNQLIVFLTVEVFNKM